MNWLKNNWVWLACIAAGAAGLYFFSKPSNPGSEYLEKARAAKAELDEQRRAQAAAEDHASQNGQAAEVKADA